MNIIIIAKIAKISIGEELVESIVPSSESSLEGGALSEESLPEPLSDDGS